MSAVASDVPTGDDIRQLRQAVAGVLGTADTDTLPSPGPGWRQGWGALAELGITTLCVREDQGGLGDQVEVAAGVASELGAGLCGVPYAGLVAATHALAHAATGEDGATGSARPTAGDGDGDGDDRASASLGASAHDPDDRPGRTLAAIVDGSLIAGYGRLSTDGIAHTIDGAAEVGVLVLEDPSGELLLFDDPNAWTLAESAPVFDVSRSCADVRIDHAAGHRMPPDPVAADLYGLLLAADAVGGAERVLDRTVAYAKDRQAFGKAIGGFQAVQHRLADHAVRLRGMSLLVAAAARALATEAADAHRSVMLAETSVSEGSTHLLHDLLQLTGAIGFTWEYGLHFYERRAHHDARLAANPRRARHAVADLEAWTR